MTQKPESTLTQLEDEPETALFGCTYTEITISLRKALIVVVVAALVIATIIRWEVSTVLGMFIGGAYFYYLVKNYGKNRSDKPLYYHKHLSSHKTNLFIKPAPFYQRERNDKSLIKKHK